MASSLSDILSTIQNGVIALNNMAVQIKGSFNNILSRFVTDEANIAALAALVPAPKITSSLGGDVALNNAANYFDGPSIAQGSSGTWFASGTVTVTDTAGSSLFSVRLWDGTTVIASAKTTSVTANNPSTISLSGYMASPAGNLRISVKDTLTVTGKILFNASGDSKDSTISAIRIA